MMTYINRIKDIMILCWHYNNAVFRKSMREIGQKPEKLAKNLKTL